MPQLGSAGEDDLGASDEMIAFKDEGDQEEKIRESAFTERDLADLKSSLVNESEVSPAAHAPAEVSGAAGGGRRAAEGRLGGELNACRSSLHRLSGARTMRTGSTRTSWPITWRTVSYCPSSPPLSSQLYPLSAFIPPLPFLPFSLHPLSCSCSVCLSLLLPHLPYPPFAVLAPICDVPGAPLSL